MRESYPPPAHRSSPALPELPERPPDKFQFSLKQLLAFMFASAVLATAARYLIQLFGQIPDAQIAGLFNVIVLALVFGAMLYCLIRGPFLAIHAARISRRWRTIKSHRRQLETWSRQRLQQRSQPPAYSDSPPEPPS